MLPSQSRKPKIKKTEAFASMNSQADMETSLKMNTKPWGLRDGGF